MIKLRFLLAAALLSTSVGVHAANYTPTSPLIQIGDDIDILFDSSLAFEVTDNLFTAAKGTSSVMTTFTPGLTLEYGKESPVALTLSAKRGYVYFNKSTLASLEDERDALSGNLCLASGGPLTVTLDSSYRVTARNDELSAQGITGSIIGSTLVRQSNYAHNLDVEYKLTERTKVNIGFANTYNKYLNATQLRVKSSLNPSNPFFDTIQNNTNTLTALNNKSIPVSIDYQAPGEKITYGLKFQHDVTDYAPAPFWKQVGTGTVDPATLVPVTTNPGPLASQLVKSFYGLTAKGQPTSSGKLNVTAKVGYAVSRTDNQPSGGIPSYSVNVSHTLSELITHSIVLSRDISASAAGATQAVRSYTYATNFNAATDLTLNLLVTKSDVNAGGLGVNTMVYTLGANYKYNPHLSLQFGYNFMNTDIPATPAASFSANTFTASAAFRF